MKGGIQNMKNFKKLCKVVVLCLCILVGTSMVSIVSYAKEVVTYVEPRLAYISTYNTELVISNTGLATITGEVRGKTGVTNAYVKVTLQKYASGDWVDVEDWEDSRNGRNVFISETYQVTRGTYRVVMTCSANSETKTATSAQRTY